MYERGYLYEEKKEKESVSSEDSHGDFVVTVAFIINLIDAILKFIAAYFTGSKSLFAEGVHTSIDTLNQAVLFIGKSYFYYTRSSSFPSIPITAST